MEAYVCPKKITTSEDSQFVMFIFISSLNIHTYLYLKFIYTHTHLKFIHIHRHANMHVHICTQAYIHTCTHICVHICMNIPTSVCKYISISDSKFQVTFPKLKPFLVIPAHKGTPGPCETTYFEYICVSITYTYSGFSNFTSYPFASVLLISWNFCSFYVLLFFSLWG